MSTFFAYGDVHNRIEAAQKFLLHRKPKKVIWMGDFTDSHDHDNDTPFEACKTGLWLKETMELRPDDIFIQSNHDLCYRFPQSGKYAICGWTPQKHEAFHTHFPREYWSRFVIAHLEEWNEQLVYFSHAGLHETFFPYQRFDPEVLRALSIFALGTADKADKNWFLDHWDYGPMWMHFSRMKRLEGISQVVGHTRVEAPEFVQYPAYPQDSIPADWNLAIDCAPRYYIIFKEKNIVAYDSLKGRDHQLKLNGQG